MVRMRNLTRGKNMRKKRDISATLITCGPVYRKKD